MTLPLACSCSDCDAEFLVYACGKRRNASYTAANWGDELPVVCCPKVKKRHIWRVKSPCTIRRQRLITSVISTFGLQSNAYLVHFVAP